MTQEVLSPSSQLYLHADQYRAIGLSVSHLDDACKDYLTACSDTLKPNSVLSREYGWFVKLHKPEASNPDVVIMWSETYPGIPNALAEIFSTVSQAGFSMIEFDVDADQADCLPVFE